MSSNNELPIDVVVCTLNEAQNISDCLHCVRLNKPAKIIVIDGGSSDDTILVAQMQADIVINAGNVGLSAQRQLALGYVTQPYVAFVDADDRIENRFLSILLNELMSLGATAIDGLCQSHTSSSYWQDCWSNYINESRPVPKIGNMVGRPCIYSTPHIKLIGFNPFFRCAMEDTNVSIIFERNGLIQANGTAISRRIHEKTFLGSIKKFFSYGSGYAKVTAVHPSKLSSILIHILYRIPIEKPFRRLPSSISFWPFYLLFSFVSLCGFSSQYISFIFRKSS